MKLPSERNRTAPKERIVYRYVSAGILAAMVTYSFAGEIMTKFFDYPVGEIYKGTNAKVKLAPDLSAHFRSALLEAGAQRVNFAGHYVVFEYACGGGCITGSVLDAITGEVVARFPGAYIEGDEPESFNAQYKVDSSLMIITGKSAYRNKGIKTKCYDFKKNEFKEIRCD